MTDVTPSQYIIGILLFTFVIVGGISFIVMFNDDDNTFIDQEKFTTFNESFNKLNDVTTEVNTLKTGITDADTDFGAFGVLNSLISNAWQSLKLLFTSFSFMDSVFAGISALFGVPTWVSALIGLLITVIIVFAIYAAIFQSNKI